MKNPKDMNGRQVYQWLERTATALSNHIARGNRINNQRSYELIDRYHDLKADAQTRRYHACHHRTLWDDFCEEKGYATSHDAYDFFA